MSFVWASFFNDEVANETMAVSILSVKRNGRDGGEAAICYYRRLSSILKWHRLKRNK